MSADLLERLREVGDLNDTWSSERLGTGPATLGSYASEDATPIRLRSPFPAVAAAVLVLAGILVAGALAFGGGETVSPAGPSDDRSSDLPPPAETSEPELPSVTETTEFPLSTEPTTDPGTVPPFAEDVPGPMSGSEFCTLALPSLTDEVDASYVGSDEHVRWFDDVLAVAPDEMVEDLRAVRDFFDRHVDHSADPDSVLIQNFPTDVQEQAARIQAQIAQLC